MNRSSLPIIILVALVSGAAGWFLHTPPVAPEKTTDVAVAPKPAVATAPTAAKVAAPLIAPAPVANSTMTSTPAPGASPTRPAAVVSSVAVAPAPATPGVTPPELTNVIMELSTLAAAGDLISLYENYAPPQKMAALTPEQKTFIEDQIRKQMEGPNAQRMIQGQVALIQALSTVTPTMNSAGDHATFQVPTPKDMAPEGSNLPPTIPINFVKIDGKWYLDQ